MNANAAKVSVNAKKIATIGMLLALQVIAGRFFSIKLELVTIGFIFLPLSLTGALFGPIWGGVAGVLGDFLIAVTGSFGYFPPMATTAFLSGLIYGLFLYRKPLTTKRIILCVLVESLVCSVLLQTYWLTMLTGKGYWVLMPTRLIQNLMVAPVSIVCMRLILPRVVSAVNALYGGAASAAQK